MAPAAFSETPSFLEIIFWTAANPGCFIGTSKFVVIDARASLELLAYLLNFIPYSHAIFPVVLAEYEIDIFNIC